MSLITKVLDMFKFHVRDWLYMLKAVIKKITSLPRKNYLIYAASCTLVLDV